MTKLGIAASLVSILLLTGCHSPFPPHRRAESDAAAQNAGPSIPPAESASTAPKQLHGE